ncbi:hypothetical protein B296_00004704 [Ensete ventricosum]|uniref:Uncharacterized protein n=1 Tax=Ensete ventricosum TaxID=4639 RepID=A0A426XE24_ENSVE|nr:hypothetical protein B296_00004704 [Ensete ventricosum]
MNHVEKGRPTMAKPSIRAADCSAVPETGVAACGRAVGWHTARPHGVAALGQAARGGCPWRARKGQPSWLGLSPTGATPA